MTIRSNPSETTNRKTVFGSTTQLYHEGHIIINPSTGERVQDALKQSEVRRKMRDERAAEKIIFALRDRCVRPHMHIPSSEELARAFEALRVLWLLLPPIKRLRGESNKTYFLRTLHEVGRFRGVDMFAREK